MPTFAEKMQDVLLKLADAHGASSVAARYFLLTLVRKPAEGNEDPEAQAAFILGTSETAIADAKVKVSDAIRAWNESRAQTPAPARTP